MHRLITDLRRSRVFHVAHDHRSDVATYRPVRDGALRSLYVIVQDTYIFVCSVISTIRFTKMTITENVSVDVGSVRPCRPVGSINSDSVPFSAILRIAASVDQQEFRKAIDRPCMTVGHVYVCRHDPGLRPRFPPVEFK